MKKIMFIALAIFVMCSSFTSLSPEGPRPNANTIMVPVGKTGKTISLVQLSRISVSEYQTLSGKKMGLFDRMGFKKAQKQLRNSIAEDGTLQGKLAKYYDVSSSGFHLGGLALGLFLGLIGVLIAYVAFSDSNKKARIKWAWIGFGAAVLLLGLGLLAFL